MVTAWVCSFKRTEAGEIENGVMIDEDKLIIDRNGQVVPSPVWKYWNKPELGCFIVPK